MASILEISVPGQSDKVTHKVEAVNLESFRLESASYYLSVSCNNIDFPSCGALRYLDFMHTKFVHGCFDSIQKFPLLEILILNACHASRHMGIKSQHLKSLKSMTLKLKP
ncbi:hypothetical protein DVH24_011440 [Malus domestica]|uniref:FBD domain-containing protein n=1 Tax=Malus domestica TaxID=3750 RepID=A0A498JVB7_MALDO|nr:hypothetical protein DVH24_011440 [Malus domestica]